MFAPGQRLVHPEFGDITADVIEELNAMARHDEPVILEREQAEIAAAAGTQARDLSCGRITAQIHPDVFDYWAQREGLGFWYDKGNTDHFLRDNPSCKVESKNPRLVVGYGTGMPSTSRRRGRWGCAVPCRS